MRMNRRDFLKGMLAISAVAAIPMVGMAPETPASFLDIAPIFEISDYLETEAKKWGRLGRLRVGESWFPLEDASITMRRVHTPKNMGIIGKDYQISPQYPKEYPLIASPWKIELAISVWTPNDVWMIEEISQEKEFEINAGEIGFMGKGFATTFGFNHTLYPDGEYIPTYLLTLEGTEKLVRKAAGI
jgi:hypothetical protein